MKLEPSGFAANHQGKGNTMTEQIPRQVWLSTLAKADPSQLEQLVSALDATPDYDTLRNPETGLVMVRGKSGGVGRQFNLGEMTVTRGAIRLPSGETGVSYVAGRNKKHAELAAVVDAMMQNADLHPVVNEKVLEPIKLSLGEKRSSALRKRAATRVEFFTMTRDREDKK